MDRVQAFWIFFVFSLVLYPLQKGLAQRVYSYDFSDGLKSDNDSAPPLHVLGTEGQFVRELLPELGDTKRTVYQFEANAGLQFNNREANGFLNGSYTIEIYFRLKELDSWKRVLDFKNRKSDNGCYIYEGRLNFFNFATGEKAPVKPNEYVHYVFSRDVETHQIKMYVDGESKVEFIDPGDEATLGEEQVLNFFQDDLIAGNEASAGAVALIRIYDRVMTPVFVRQRFRQLARTIDQPARLPKPDIEKPTPVVSESKQVEEPPRRESLVEVSGKVYNGRNLNPLDSVDVLVRRVNNDSIIGQSRTASGAYRFQLPPSDTYRITARAPGFQPKSILVTPSPRQGEIKTLMNMAEESYDEPIAILSFSQSDTTLISSALTTLDSIVSYLKDRPDLLIRLHGHTDNVGDFDKNLDLSRKRTAIVKQYLSARGIPENRMQVQGYGPTRPRSSNNSEVSRQQNRRVEVWVEPIKR